MRTTTMLVLSTVILMLAVVHPTTTAQDARRSDQVHAQDRSSFRQASRGTTLQAMLAHVPATLPELDDPDQAIIAYADIAAQLDAFDLEPPDSMTDEGFVEWAATTTGLPFPSPAAQYQRFFREDYGFDLLQTDQTLSISLPPFELSLYRGRFDEREIVRTLRDLGYRPVGADERPILSIRGDYEQDISAPTAYKFSAMNYATILDDGTLAFASAQDALEAVLDVEAGEMPSLAERSDIAALLADVPDDLASVFLIHGSALAYEVPEELLNPDSTETPDIEAIATEIADRSDMPPVVMALLGMTAGGPIQPDDESVALPPDSPDAHAVIALLTLSPEAAGIAAPIIEDRLATGSSTQTDRPYAELFPRRTVEAVPEVPVVLIELTLGEETHRGILMQMLFNRDLGFLAW